METSVPCRPTGAGGWAAFLLGVFAAAGAAAPAASASPSDADGGPGIQSGSWMKKSSSRLDRLSSWKTSPRDWGGDRDPTTGTGDSVKPGGESSLPANEREILIGS